MAFRIAAGQAIEGEVRRIADRQLQLAIAGLKATGDRESDRRVHTARRHVKKVRALIRLVEPCLAGGGEATQRRLRKVSRMLAAVADGEAIVGTLDALARRYPHDLSASTFAALQAVLQAHEARVDHDAARASVLRTAARRLAWERTKVPTWRLTRRGLRAIAPGLRRSVRAARRAMRRAVADPTTRRYNAWRRRVKDLWFHLRLLEGWTGGALAEEQLLLERLDGLLGEAHNCALLCDVLAAHGVGSRQESARILRLVRRYRCDLRRRAEGLAPRVHATKPRAFVTRVADRWHPPRTADARAPAGAPCHGVA
jgi:hypothetical protein